MEEALSGLGAGMRQLLNDKDRQIAQLQLALREREQASRVAEERLRDENARLRALLESTGGADAIVADSEATAKSLLVIEEQARVIDEQQRRIRMLQRSSRAAGHHQTRSSALTTPASNNVAASNGATVLQSHRRLITPYMAPDRDASAVNSTATRSAASAAAARAAPPPVTPLHGGLSFATPRLNGVDALNGPMAASSANSSDGRLSALVAQQESVRDRLLELREEKLKAMQQYREAQARAANNGATTTIDG